MKPRNKRRRRRTFASVTLDAIKHKADVQELTATEIWREIDRDPRFPKPGPTLRSVQDIVRELRSASGVAPEPWRFADADPDEAALVLPVLAALQSERFVSKDGIAYRLALIGRESGDWPRYQRGATLTRADGEWIARIRRAVPDLQPLTLVFDVARLYRTHTARNEPTDALDSFLAFAPWRSTEAWERYQEAIDRTLVRPPPFLMKGESLVRFLEEQHD